MLQSLWDNILGWLGLGATVAAAISLLSWIPGVGTALTIAASLLQMAAPVVNGVLSVVVWAFVNIILPGLKGIFSSVSVILTIVILFTSYYLFDKANDAIRYRNLQRQANSCTSAIREGKPIQPSDEEPLLKVFPWSW